MIKTIILLGNHIQALGLSRQAAAAGFRVELYNDSGACVTRFSNTCSKFHLVKNDEDLLKRLLTRQPDGKSCLLVATNDRLIGLLMDNYAALSEKFHLSIPSPEITNICFNKRLTYQLCQQQGIPIPESHFPDSEQELIALADSGLRLPVVLKPAVMFRFYSGTGKKVFLCHTREELLENYRKILDVIPANEVIVQQFLTGGAPSLFSFGSFCAHGKVFGNFVANRIRQKPMDFGISTCFAHTVLSPEIDEWSQLFLQKLGYFGLSETEWMLDPETGKYMLLEINPRAWKWHSLQDKVGLNLLKEMVDYLNGKTPTPTRNTKANIAWIERVTDTFVVAKEIAKGRMRYSDYRKTMQMPKQSACWSFRDPKPAIFYLILTPYLFFTR